MAVFGPLQNGRPLADHQKFVKGDYVGDLYSYAKFVAHLRVVSGQMSEI